MGVVDHEQTVPGRLGLDLNPFGSAADATHETWRDRDHLAGREDDLVRSLLHQCHQPVDGVSEIGDGRDLQREGGPGTVRNRPREAPAVAGRRDLLATVQGLLEQVGLHFSGGRIGDEVRHPEAADQTPASSPGGAADAPS